MSTKKLQVQAPEKQLAEIIRLLRENSGLAQDEFYFRHGIKPATGKAWEQGRNKPTAVLFLKLIQSVGKDAAEVVLRLMPDIHSGILRKLDYSRSEADARMALHTGLETILDRGRGDTVREKIAEMIYHFGGLYGGDSPE
jgi:DNA-binding transcriptional regulator YiaG